MKKKTTVVAGLTATGILMGAVVSGGGPVNASSHREAPMISQDPTADNTDVFAFRDPTDPTKLNIIANFIGLEDPVSTANLLSSVVAR